MSKQNNTTRTLADELRDAVAAIDGVKLVDSPSGAYYTVKIGKTTVGYVNGKRRLRIDFPIRDGYQEQLFVEKRQQIAKAVKQLRSYAQETT